MLIHSPPLSISSVVKNCTISDAKDNGIYSMCMLFLRLRNLYKWEKGLEPWEEAESSELIDWIDQKETLWEKLESLEFQNIEVNNLSFSPFDVTKINNELTNNELIYGAGLGKSMKAIFFLAQKESITRIDDYETVISLQRHLNAHIFG